MKPIEQAKMLATVLGQDGIYLKGTIYKREAIPAEIIQEIEAGARTVEVIFSQPSAPPVSPVKVAEPTDETPFEPDVTISGGDTPDDSPPAKKKAVPKKAVAKSSLRRAGK